MNQRVFRTKLGLKTLSLLALTALGTGCVGAPDDPAEREVGACREDASSSGCESESVASAAEELSVNTSSKTRWQRTAPFQDSAKLQERLAALDAANTPILDMTSSADGAWVITTASTNYTGGTLPGNMAFWLSFLKSKGQTIRAVDINTQGGWVIIGDTMYKTGGEVNQLAKDKIAQYFANGWAIRDVEVSTNGYVILGQGTLVSYANTGAQLSAFLADRIKSRRRIEQVEIGLDGGWVVIADQEAAVADVAPIIRGSLAAAARAQAHMSKLMLGPGDGFVLYSHGTVSATPGNAMESIEYGAPGGQNLWERMSAIGVPGVSIAIIENNQVAYARGYGVLKQGEDAHVLATTPFDMASLSKFIGALTMMKLDSDGAYNFDIDNSVMNSAKPGGIIEAWKTEGEDDPGTYGFANVDISSQLSVAHFMRHQSDFVPSGGSPSFNLGSQGLFGATTLKLLLGYDCTNGCGYNGVNFAWTAGGAGPVASNYDSVNFLVPQAVAEDVTGKPAWQLMKDYFFTPMGLSNISGYTSSTLSSRAAWQHDSNGPRATRTVYPWTFAGGVYSAPMDYAEMMILALNQGRDSSGVQRLPASAVNRMLQVQNGNVGFGVFADFNANITEANDNAFVHSGSHGGRARTYMCGNPSRDAGIVIVFNADIGDGPDAGTTNDTIDLRNYILARYMASVGWAGNCQ